MAYKLIVADDSPSVQKAVKMAFSGPEFETYPFDDCWKVIQNLGQINPNVILLRLSLPPKDGYEVGRYLKSQEQFKKASLILLKGVYEPLDREQIVEIDYDEIIQVPFASERLVELVRDIIARKNDPQTLPEELELDEISAAEIQTELEARVKAIVKKETFEREQELEKKIKTQLLLEIKSWLLNKLEEIEKHHKT